MKHRSERRNARPSGDKDRVAQGRAQDEIAEGPLAGNLGAFPHVAEKVRHEAILHPVKAESEAVVRSRRGSDGISAGDLLAIGLVRLQGEPLSGYEAETAKTEQLKFEVPGGLGKRYGADQPSGKGLELSHHLLDDDGRVVDAAKVARLGP